MDSPDFTDQQAICIAPSPAVIAGEAPVSAPAAPEAAPAPEPTPAPAEAPAEAPAPAIEPEPERDHELPLLGHFVDVVSGPYAGLWGVFLDVAEFGPDFKPLTALVRNRDHAASVDLAIVDYDALRPSKRNGGR